MDQQQTPDRPESSLFNMSLDVQNSMHLRSAASWARVLGFCGIILGVLISFLCIYTYSTIGNYDNAFRRSDNMWANSMTYTRGGLIFMIIVGVIFIMGGVFAYGFGNKILTALRSNDEGTMNKGFASLRNYFAIRSITLIILLLLFLLSLLSSVG